LKAFPASSLSTFSIGLLQPPHTLYLLNIFEKRKKMEFLFFVEKCVCVSEPNGSIAEQRTKSNVLGSK
jgi:hypothetical protein